MIGRVAIGQPPYPGAVVRETGVLAKKTSLILG